MQWKFQLLILLSTNEITSINFNWSTVFGLIERSVEGQKFPSHWPTTVSRKAGRNLNGLGLSVRFNTMANNLDTSKCGLARLLTSLGLATITFHRDGIYQFFVR